MNAVSETSAPVYVYDGECAMCSRFVRFLIAHETTGTLRIATAQSPAGRAIYEADGFCPDAMETAILRANGRSHTHLDLFAEGLALCGWPWKAALAVKLVPRPLSNWLYRRIANNRHRFNSGVCPLPSEEMRERMID